MYDVADAICKVVVLKKILRRVKMRRCAVLYILYKR